MDKNEKKKLKENKPCNKGIKLQLKGWKEKAVVIKV